MAIIKVTKDTLNSLVEFDCVFRVIDALHIDDDVPGTYAPSSYDGELDSDQWEYVNGYSGQYGYRGPIMHDSEYLGGSMARDVLSAPGIYCVIEDTNPGDDDMPNGWALVRYVGDDA